MVFTVGIVGAFPAPAKAGTDGDIIGAFNDRAGRRVANCRAAGIAIGPIGRVRKHKRIRASEDIT